MLPEKQSIEENIRFIKKIMQDTKRAELSSGPFIIMWGILIAIAQASTFFLITIDYSNLIWPMWTLVVTIGIIISVYLGLKFKKDNTFSEKVLSSTWLAFGISAIVFVFVSPLGKSGIEDIGVGINPVICLLLGMAYRITGIVYDKGWIKYISFCWWAGAILLFRWQGVHSYLVFAVFMLLFQVLPGIKILSDYRKELAGDEK